MARQKFAAWLAAGSLLLAFTVAVPARAEIDTPNPPYGVVDPDGLEGLQGNPGIRPGIESACSAPAKGATSNRRVSMITILRVMRVLGF